MSRPRSAPRRRCQSPGVVDFIVETNQEGEQARHASRSPACRRRTSSHLRTTCPPCLPRTRGARMAPRCGSAWTSVAFSTVRRSPVWPPCTPREGEADSTVLAEVALPGQIRSQQVPTACIPRCWMPVFSPSRLIRRSRPWAKCAGVAVGCPSTTRLRLGPQRPLLLHAGDQSRRLRHRGRHRRARRARDGPARRAGAAIGHRSIRERPQDRVLAERLLTIEWRQRELPEAEYADAGTWLLISTTATADAVATTLTDALKAMARNAPPCAGRRTPTTPSNAEQLARPSACRWIHRRGDPHRTEKRRRRGRSRCWAASMCSIWCVSPANCQRSPASSPRLYVVTRNAQTVLAGDWPTWSRLGCGA